MKMKVIFSSLLSLAYCIFILPINETVVFTSPYDKKHIYLAYCLKIVFAVLLFSSTFFILNFVEKIKKHNKFYLSWLKYSAIYLMIMLLIFLLIYPGHFVWDEFNVLDNVKIYSAESWQHYFTNIYYTMCLYLIPTAATIVLVQIIVISLIIGYAIARTKRYVGSKHYSTIMFILFLSPPIILNNFYPLRLTLYSYLELLLVINMICIYLDHFKVKNKYFSYILNSTLITILAFWRSEGLYYLLMIPVLIIILQLINRTNSKSFKPYLAVLLSSLVVLSSFIVSHHTKDERYELTTMINPLSVMLQKPLSGDKINQRLASMNRVVDITLVKNNPSHDEVPSFWGGAVRNNYKQYYYDFKKDYFYIVLHNPNSFIRTRINTFLSTNSFGNKMPFVNRNSVSFLASSKQLSRNQEAVISKFEKNDPFSKPLNKKLKEKISRLLLLQQGNGFSILGHLFWNTIPTILILLVILLTSLVKRRLFFVLIILLVLIRVPLLFITAPANYFMYYLPVYITGNFLILLFANMHFNIDRIIARVSTKRK